jgi:hypothetical protein
VTTRASTLAGLRGTGVRSVALLLACAAGPSCAGADFSLSGFATLGYAISDEPFAYLRYIDDQGTFKADSLAGVQLEARFDRSWSATVQGVVSAPRTRDYGYEAKIRWAFVSYRPANEWLFRAGRLRPPVLLNTQNAEVGVTYVQARLPAEVYSLSPVYDVDGAALTRTWTAGDADVSLDAYWGRTKLKFRLPALDEAGASASPGSTPLVNPGQFFPEKVTLAGVVLSGTTPDLLLRAGLHYAIARADSDLQFAEDVAVTTVPAPVPLGGTVYVPVGTGKLDVVVLTLGADWHRDGWRVTGEYGRRSPKHSVFGIDSWGAYVTVAHDFGRWTPYVTQARLLSDPGSRTLAARIEGTPVPLLAQGPPYFLPATYHRDRAHGLVVFDQLSTMLGAAYHLSATSAVKVEWMSTRVGAASALVDGDVHDQRFNVFSLSYSTTF